MINLRNMKKELPTENEVENKIKERLSIVNKNFEELKKLFEDIKSLLSGLESKLNQEQKDDFGWLGMRITIFIDDIDHMLWLNNFPEQCHHGSVIPRRLFENVAWFSFLLGLDIQQRKSYLSYDQSRPYDKIQERIDEMKNLKLSPEDIKKLQNIIDEKRPPKADKKDHDMKYLIEHMKDRHLTYHLYRGMCEYTHGGVFSCYCFLNGSIDRRISYNISLIEVCFLTKKMISTSKKLHDQIRTYNQ